MDALIEAITERLCDPAGPHEIYRRPHRVEAGGRTWATTANSRIVVAVEAPGADLPLAPGIPGPARMGLGGIVDPAGVEWEGVDGAAFRVWVGPYNRPVAPWNVRAGRIGGKPFDRNLIAYALALLPGSVTRIARWGPPEVHALTIDGGAWRVTVAGLRDVSEYRDAPAWHSAAVAEGR